MAQQFLLKCECGQDIEVREQQAGSEVRCVSCGQMLAIPRLRELQQLPHATAQELAPSRPAWGLGRGMLFSLGLALILVGGSVAGFYTYWRSQLNIQKPVLDPRLNPDIQKLDIEQAWTLWEQVRELEMSRRTPAYLENRRIGKIFLRISLIAGLVALVGLIAMAAALLAPRGGPGGRRPA
ncbi:MAG: hypothetical protein AAGA95_18750 [Pseudomonadota bacterium]